MDVRRSNCKQLVVSDVAGRCVPTPAPSLVFVGFRGEAVFEYDKFSITERTKKSFFMVAEDRTEVKIVLGILN